MESEEELIPRGWWKQLDESGPDFNLLAALSDYMRDLGDEVGAEAVHWAVAKGRWAMGGWTPDSFGHRFAEGFYALLPNSLHAVKPVPTDLAGGIGTAECYRRLVWRWKQCSPELRQSFWEWSPPVKV